MKENNEKIFTKNNDKDIIEKKYNPSNINNYFYEREGLFMKETKEIILKSIVKELSQKYNRKELMIQIMFEKCEKLDYNVKESKKIIEKFLKTIDLSKTCPIF